MDVLPVTHWQDTHSEWSVLCVTAQALTDLSTHQQLQLFLLIFFQTLSFFFLHPRASSDLNNKEFFHLKSFPHSVGTNCTGHEENTNMPSGFSAVACQR